MSRNINVDCILVHNSNFLYKVASLEIVLIVLKNIIKILIISARMSTQRHLKKEVFLNKGYDVIIYHVNKIILYILPYHQSLVAVAFI